MNTLITKQERSRIGLIENQSKIHKIFLFPGERVLLVDSHPHELDKMARILDELGCPTQKAACCDEAIRVIESDPDQIDCIFINMIISSSDQLDFFQKIRARSPQLKIAFKSKTHRVPFKDAFDPWVFHFKN